MLSVSINLLHTDFECLANCVIVHLQYFGENEQIAGDCTPCCAFVQKCNRLEIVVKVCKRLGIIAEVCNRLHNVSWMYF